MTTTRSGRPRRRGAGRWWVLTVTVPLLVCGPLAAAASAYLPGIAVTVPTPSPTDAATTPSAPETDTTTPATPSAPEPSPTPEPTPTPDPTDTQGPTPTPEPSGPQEPTSTPTTEVPSQTPTTSPSPGAPTPEVTDEPQTPVISPILPASSTSTQSAASWIIAVVVLAVAALVVTLLVRRAPTLRRTRPSAPPRRLSTAARLRTAVRPPTTVLPQTMPLPQAAPTLPYGLLAPSTTAAGVTFAAIEAVGEAMLDATYSVITIEAALLDIARVNAYPATGVVVLPTALFVSTRGGGELYTGAMSSGNNALLLHQVDALDHLVRAARAGDLTPAQILSSVHAIRTAPPPYSTPVRIAAYVLLCAGIAVILGASWAGTAIASVLGALVGAARLVIADVSRQRIPLVTVALAFGVSTTVFLLARLGWDPGILPSLIAPLVILLPGALLTTGIIELSAGQMMSGAGRLMTGFMQLVLLAVGIVAGALLVGVPKIVLDESHQPIGAIAPWIAVAAFGVGVVVHQCGRRESIPWILLVLYVAYGAQVIGEVFFGGVLSALIGAFVMTPVAIFVSRLPTGPAAAVSFLPAFWLLVPGALGLVGVASILGGDDNGGSTLVTTMATMVAIALGILAGSALGARSQFAARDVL